ncbi:DUF7344 domain-containing protein [Halomarina pelagica]|uniref:DUF7344 domain-containing protein n=1 Tax=Halomarina pelagica TaxID=2961599 RepID=UPI0020C42408|nr:ArsR family transcriptional regulator [Halomarina sp. BND7]
MTERSLDTLLQLVADRRRRQVIHHLRHEANGKTTIDDLVDRLHNGGSDAVDQPTDRKQLAIQLYHAHLPKLADQGVVDFDPENGAIQYRSDDQFETILDSLPDELSLASP